MARSVDIINTLYGELFSVRLLHSGYLTPTSNVISNDIRLYPDKQTKKLFTNYQITYRLFGNTLVCLVRSRLFAPPATNLKVPFMRFLDNVRIRFLMHTSPSFLSRTEVVATGKNQVYLFSNRVNHVIEGEPFISRPIVAYDSSNGYDAGAIVQEGGQLFVALQPSLASENIPITDVAYWREILPVEPLVNQVDLEGPVSIELEEACFAVIDIYNSGTLSSGYDLFITGPENQLRSPVYNIRFKSKI
jgi:hypothetical protein